MDQEEKKEEKKEEKQVEKELTGREQIYIKYQQQQDGLPAEQEEPKEPEVTEAPEEVKPPEEETPKAGEKKEEKKEEKREKLVPYDALHEERMRRKAEAEARKRAEERAKEFESELQRIKQVEEEGQVITDYDKELLEVKREVAAFKSLEGKRQQREQEEARSAAARQFGEAMKQMDRELEAEGYPGFEEAQGAVYKEIHQLVAEDEANRALDNIPGWKQIYRERFYPKMSSKFSEAQKRAEIKAKEDLKTKANLVSIPGKAPAKPKTAEDLSPEEVRSNYFKMRRRE